MRTIMRLLIPSLVLVLAACTGRSPVGHPEGTPIQDLTVISYNIRVGFGPGDRSERGGPTNYLDQIVEWFQDQDADIILLQEVDRDTRRADNMDQLEYMAEKMGFHGVFAPAIPLPPDGQYGVAILSRWPIKDFNVIPLYQPDYERTNPDYPAWYSEQRVLLVTEMETPHGSLHALTTHLGLTEAQRKIQIEEIATVLDGLPGREPVIFGGDINALPEAPEVRPLRARLNDAYLASPEPIPMEERLTFHARNPNRCIDYIFVTPNLVEVQSVEVPRIQLSDHRPVMAKLRAFFPATR
ncbi:MAG: endonuclease/exonuclease/phosphatase family protein [Candidatus Sumerlaeia bacterium]|nr:endonuclease/exonuclease/phosphatase family protein [Candidatus Sumerlaeia bacterium]